MANVMVLLSGGQDSTTSLFWALKMFDEVHAISFDYGQRHASELEAARAIASMMHVEHSVVELGTLLGRSSALTGDHELKAEGGLPDVLMPQGLPTSFVPGRNHMFLSIAAIKAAELGISDIVTGVCQTDYSGYPDCRRVFIDALEVALTTAFPSSMGPVRIHTPLMHMTKAETVKLMLRLHPEIGRQQGPAYASFCRTVTCYYGARPGCGTCPACVLRAKGFEEAGVNDPANV